MIAILYGSSTGRTEEVADELQKLLPGSKVFDVCDFPMDETPQYELLILGTSTWGIGEVQESWKLMGDELAAADLGGTALAFFGLGDQKSFPESFLGGLAKLHDRLAPLGQRTLGRFTDPGFTFESCEAFRNGVFVGLALDEDNQSSKTEDRIKRWTAQLLSEL